MIAGTVAGGYADGTSSDAWFYSIHGLVSDGASLWVVDNGNARVRRIVPGSPLPGSQPAVLAQTVAINPGTVTTFAGNGSDATLDAVGTAAGFTSLGGLVVVNGIGYAGTVGAIRKVDMSSGLVSTLAGHPTERGCVDSAVAAQVRFQSIIDTATDGYYLYTTQTCGPPNNSYQVVRRTSLATGATSSVAVVFRAENLVVGPDRMLYVTTGQSREVVQVDPVTGRSSTFASVDLPVYAISADGTSLWVATNAGTDQVQRISLADRSVTTLTSGASLGYASLTSAGDYLYQSGGQFNTVIRRISKVDGSWVIVAGTSNYGYTDGTSSDAWFSTVHGIASDGTNLWIADAGNHRLRRLAQGVPLPHAQPTTLSTTVSIDPAVVTTLAGNGVDATVDGVGTQSSFRAVEGMVVVAGSLYVGQPGAIRKVNLASGAVTTFAGDPVEIGCVDALNPANVRFGNRIYQLSTDGYFLYSANDCGGGVVWIRRTSLATGATSTVTKLLSGSVVVGPDSYLYVIIGGGSASAVATVLKVDPINGTATTLTTIQGGTGIATIDGSYLWTGRSNGSVYLVVRVTLSDGTTTDVYNGYNYARAMESAGDYLYLGSNGLTWPSSLTRVSKADFSAVFIAGDRTVGYADGVGANARFDGINGLASDGRQLFVSDQYNHRVRVVSDLQLFSSQAAGYGWYGYGGFWGGVNAPLGNFVKTNVDASVVGVGPELKVERTYNSLDTNVGAFGQGWTFNYDMSWARDAASGRVSILFPDGRREVHTPNGAGEFTPPTGYFSTLVSDGSGGYRLTQKDRTVYGFGNNGKLTSIADSNGRRLSLSYDVNQNLAQVTSASGRSLFFTWSNGRIIEVRTDPVTPSGPLVWTYTYNGVEVRQACDPSSNCTAYTYMGGRVTLIAKARGNTEVELAYNADGTVQWRKDGEGNVTRLDRPIANQVRVTDPAGRVTVQAYDNLYRLVTETDALGRATSHEYDDKGNRTKTTDANANFSLLGYDSRGNVTSETDPEAHVAYKEYDAQDNLVVSRDPRSTNPSDETFATHYGYDGAGNKLSERTPATGDFAAGVTKTWTYTNGSEPAIDGGTMPAGLVRTATDGRGKTTTSSYDVRGNLREVVDPVGLRPAASYDEVGRRLSQTVYSDSFPAGVTTSVSYDRLSRPTAVLEPQVTNVVVGTAHRKRTRTDYDANQNVITETIEDLVVGGDTPRVTVHSYDRLDREISVTDPEGGVLNRQFDAVGNVSGVTDQEGRILVTDYNVVNKPVLTKIVNFVDDPVAGSPPRELVLSTTAYDPVKRKTSETDALGRTRLYVYDKADRLISVTLVGYHNPNGSTRDVVLESHSYDAAGHPTSDVTGAGKLTVTHSWDAAAWETSQTSDPAGLNRVVGFHYDENHQLVRRTASDGARTEEVRYGYDDAGHKTSETVENGAVDVVTTWAYDQRGVATSKTDPRGNAPGGDPPSFTTLFQSDELGRTVVATGPSVTLEEYSSGVSTGRPATASGHDTFGNVTQSRDARGAVTQTTYDRLGRRSGISYVPYTNADGVLVLASEGFSYDRVGNLVASRDRRGHISSFRFDALNRVVQKTDPLVAGEPGPGKVATVYDAAGNKTAEVDQRGARHEWAYDDMNRARTDIAVVRRADGGVDRFTSTFDYDDLGNKVYTRTPTGDETRTELNAASEETRRTDPAGAVWLTSHDVAGRVVRSTDPLGRVTEHGYDLAGREVATRRYAAGGGLLSESSAAFDPAGNQTSSTSPRGVTTTFGVDGLNRSTSVSQPVSAGVSVVTSYGYDPAGNVTRRTDGRGTSASVFMTYNPWGLLESTIEPATVAYPSVTDRTYTTLYDSGGLAVSDREPGGVVVNRSFDELARLRQETATGPGVISAGRSFGYDLAGQRTSLSHPGGTVGLAYDDRGLLASASGPAGSASYTYDPTGRLTGRTDGAGATTFTWTGRGELRTASDSLSGVTRTYGSDPAGQVTSVAYTGGASRGLWYDGLGRLTYDVLTDTASSTQVRFAYGYDADNNLITKQADLSANPQSGVNTYSYDLAGRVASWTPPGSPTVTYGWDPAGNRIEAGGVTSTFDARNRLVQSPQGTHTYSPRGTLASTALTATVTSYTYDALDRLVDYNAQVAYSYDSLDRIATRNSQTFTYAGADIKTVYDGTFTVARSPTGRPLTLSNGQTTQLAGLDRHGDLAYLYNGSGVVSDTRLYDPFGQPAAQTGPTNPTLGFQSDFTDPTTTNTWMGARWYDAGRAGFLSRDTVAGQLKTPVSLNRYTYGQANPLLYFDPDGRDSWAIEAVNAAHPNDPPLASNDSEMSAAADKRMADNDAETAREERRFAQAASATNATRAQSPTGTAVDQARQAQIVAAYKNQAHEGDGADLDYRPPQLTFWEDLKQNVLRPFNENFNFGLNFLEACLGGTEAHPHAGVRECVAASLLLIAEAVTLEQLALAGKPGARGQQNAIDEPITNPQVPEAPSPPAAARTAGAVADDVLPSPKVADPKLQNYVDNIYKGTVKETRVGSGTTGDAVRSELETGQKTGGKFHTIKAEETVRGLERWLRENPNAADSDRLVAQSLRYDLLNALGGTP